MFKIARSHSQCRANRYQTHFMRPSCLARGTSTPRCHIVCTHLSPSLLIRSDARYTASHIIILWLFTFAGRIPIFCMILFCFSVDLISYFIRRSKEKRLNLLLATAIFLLLITATVIFHEMASTNSHSTRSLLGAGNGIIFRRLLRIIMCVSVLQL